MSKISSLLQTALEVAPSADKSLLPISYHDFHQRVMNLWRQWRGSDRVKSPRKVALAVSGGADSMALAYLFGQLSSKQIIPHLVVKPFIVDHQARPGSSDEAHIVAERLLDIGLCPRIITLDWPSGVIPSQLSNFESQARILRYQALGKACRREKIYSLWLGHHQDDNLETALLRVSQGHRGLGLQGIPEAAPIPECHGIYGVAESGTTLKQASCTAKDHASNRLVYSDKGYWHYFMPVADGGVCLFRPLLNYPKSRLVATCKSNNIPFVNDNTNFDPTLTPRNTVRHLLASNVLPRALQAPSILNLIGKSKTKATDIEKQSKDFFKTFTIFKFDANVGTLMVGFPDLTKPRERSTPIENEIRDNQYAQAIALRNLLDVVAPTPRRSASLEKAGHAAKKVFWPIRTIKGGILFGRSPFTLGGIKFETAQIGKLGSNNWLLTRQPFKGTTPKPVTNVRIKIPRKASEYKWTDWQLWDSRYWVRFQAARVGESEITGYRTIVPLPGHDLDLQVRPLEEVDLVSLRRLLSEERDQKYQNDDGVLSYQFLTSTLKFRAPGKVRFTLPVISHTDRQQRVHHLGLASFKKELRNTCLFEHHDVEQSKEVPNKTFWKVKWEVQYKHIDSAFYELPGFH
ncbi:hypothetical protein KEM54_003651 [Ascosphaera aggregata]|nr:hypothetical protein KEM54_003651 [Ascosphaera aggregata]